MKIKVDGNIVLCNARLLRIAVSWEKNGKLHREDGPAVIYAKGEQSWWRNGKLHNEYGPAVTHPAGSEEWWVNGERHRIDGPAVTRTNGEQEWWVNSIELSFENFNRYEVTGCITK